MNRPLKLTKNPSDPLDQKSDSLERIKKQMAKRGASPSPAPPAIGSPFARAADALSSRATDLPNAKDNPAHPPRMRTQVRLDQLVRHPDNRHPSHAAVDQLAASIQREGLLERIVVRPIELGQWQILSGETRVLALRQLGCGGLIDAWQVECDDAQALALLAEYNAARTDLTPIEKARLIQRLCLPAEAGGAGLTREQAGQIYGLESGSAASNLVRLLELPEAWQERVAAGELPQSFARLLLPYVHAPRLMAAIDRDYQACRASKSIDEQVTWQSRALLEDHLRQLISEQTRELTEGNYYNARDLKGVKDYWRYCGKHPRLFELTPEIESQLDIVELECREGKKTVTKLLATNLDLWNKLQIPLIVKQVDEEQKKRADKSSGSAKKSKDPAKPLTPAQLKAKAQEQQERFTKRIEAWRRHWLASLVATHLESHNDNTQLPARRFVLWLACGGVKALSYSVQSALDVDETLVEIVRGKRRDTDYLEAIIGGDPPQTLLASWTSAILRRERDLDDPVFPVELLESMGRDLAIDLAVEWSLLGEERLEVFLLLHQSDQLDKLAQEWEIYFKENLKRSEKIKIILASGSKRPLPSYVQPLAAAVAKKRKRGK